MMLVINFAAWGWPQWVMLGTIALNLIMQAVLHGQPRAKFNVGWASLDMAFLVGLLIAGGYFA